MGRGLVDLSGLSGDPESDDRAGKLLARWEAEIMNSSASGMGAVEYRQQPSIIPGNRRSRPRLLDRRMRRKSARGPSVSLHATYKKRKRR
ncbi:hypothetical protein SAMN05216404_12038 [Nitrosospira multiformis]|uniref:Uncharacterized protein n=1 Tax=Nitrosospira multiformis TaxID=1231 RepID=A0A1H8PG70_9PROT|nr:hypothetical protein SAMN05216404_12038 [Nitrosospira multiformis]